MTDKTPRTPATQQTTLQTTTAAHAQAPSNQGLQTDRGLGDCGGNDLELCIDMLVEPAGQDADSSPGGGEPSGGEPPPTEAVIRTLDRWPALMDLADLWADDGAWATWSARGLDTGAARPHADPLRAWARRPDEDGLLRLRQHPCWGALDAAPYLAAHAPATLSPLRLDYIARYGELPPTESGLREKIANLLEQTPDPEARRAALEAAALEASFEEIVALHADTAWWAALPVADPQPLIDALDPLDDLRRRLSAPGGEGLYAVALAADVPLLRAALLGGAIDGLASTEADRLQLTWAVEHGRLPPDREHFEALVELRDGRVAPAEVPARVASLPRELRLALGEDRLARLERWRAGGDEEERGAALDRAVRASLRADADAVAHGDLLALARETAGDTLSTLVTELQEAGASGAGALDACLAARAELRAGAPEDVDPDAFARAAFAVAVERLEAAGLGVRTLVARLDDPHARRRVAQLLGRERDGVGAAAEALAARRADAGEALSPEERATADGLLEQAARHGATLATLLPEDPGGALAEALDFQASLVTARDEHGFTEADLAALRDTLHEAFQAQAGPLGVALDRLKDHDTADKIAVAVGYRSVAQVLGRDREGVDGAVVDAEYAVERSLRDLFHALVLQNGDDGAAVARTARDNATERHASLTASGAATPADAPLPYLLQRYADLFGIPLGHHAARAGLTERLEADLGPLAGSPAPVAPDLPEPAELGDAYWRIDGADIAGIRDAHDDADKETAARAHAHHLAAQLDRIRSAWISTDAAENELLAHQAQLARAGGLPRVLAAFQSEYHYTLAFALRELHTLGEVSDATLDGTVRVEDDDLSPLASEVCGEADARRWTDLLVTLQGLDAPQRDELLADPATLGHLRGRAPDDATWDLIYRSIQGTVDDSEFLRGGSGGQALQSARGIHDAYANNPWLWLVPGMQGQMLVSTVMRHVMASSAAPDTPLDAEAILGARDAALPEDQREEARVTRILDPDMQAALDASEGGRGLLAGMSGHDEARTAREYALMGQEGMAWLVGYHDNPTLTDDRSVRAGLEALSPSARAELALRPEGREIIARLTEDQEGSRRELLGILLADEEAEVLEDAAGTGVDWRDDPWRAAVHLSEQPPEELWRIAADDARRQAWLDATAGDDGARARVQVLLDQAEEYPPGDPSADAPADGPEVLALQEAHWATMLEALPHRDEGEALQILTQCAQEYHQSPAHVRADPELRATLVEQVRGAGAGWWAVLDDDAVRLFEASLQTDADRVPRAAHRRVAELSEEELRALAADPAASAEALAAVEGHAALHEQVQALLEQARARDERQGALHAARIRQIEEDDFPDLRAQDVASAEGDLLQVERELFVQRWLARLEHIDEEHLTERQETLEELRIALLTDLPRLAGDDAEWEATCKRELSTAAGDDPDTVTPAASFAQRLVASMPAEPENTTGVLAEVPDQEVATHWASLTHPSFTGFPALSERVDDYLDALEAQQEAVRDLDEAAPTDTDASRKTLQEAEDAVVTSRADLQSHPVDASALFGDLAEKHRSRDEAAWDTLLTAIRARIEALPADLVHGVLGVSAEELGGIVWTPGNRVLLATAGAFDALEGRIQIRSAIDGFTRGDDDAAALSISVGSDLERIDRASLTEEGIGQLGQRADDLSAAIGEHSATKRAVAHAVTTYVTVVAAVVGAVVGSILTAGVGAPALVGGLAGVLVSAGAGSLNVLLNEQLLREESNAIDGMEQVAVGAVVDALLLLLTAGVGRGLKAVGAHELATDGAGVVLVRRLSDGMDSTALRQLGAGLGLAEAASLQVLEAGASATLQAGGGALLREGELDDAMREAREALQGYVSQGMSQDAVKALVGALLESSGHMDLGDELTAAPTVDLLATTGRAMGQGGVEDLAGLVTGKLNEQLLTGSTELETEDVVGLLQGLAARGAGAAAGAEAGEEHRRSAQQRRVHAARELDEHGITDPLQRRAWRDHAASRDAWEQLSPGEGPDLDTWEREWWAPRVQRLEALDTAHVEPEVTEAFRSRVLLGHGEPTASDLASFLSTWEDHDQALQRQRASQAYEKLTQEERAWYDHAARHQLATGGSRPPDLGDPETLADLRAQVARARRVRVAQWTAELEAEGVDVAALASGVRVQVLPGNDEAAREAFRRQVLEPVEADPPAATSAAPAAPEAPTPEAPTPGDPPAVTSAAPAAQEAPTAVEADEDYEETWLDLTSSLQAPVSPYTSVSDGPAPELDMGLWAPQMDRNDSWGILRM